MRCIHCVWACSQTCKMELYNIFMGTLLFLQTHGINGQTVPGVNNNATCNFTLDKIPDITAFSDSFIVDGNTQTELRAFTGLEDGDNENVMFGIGLWVDDNGTHYGENELVNEHDIANSIFSSGTTCDTSFRGNTFVMAGWLKFPSIVGVRRVGVNYMWTEFKGCIASASMVFLAKEATVVPEHRTITTSIGETVKLVMYCDGVNASDLRWKKDGGSKIMEWEGLSIVSLENVRIKDAGIYECYPEGQRHLGQHAILRLLVRECPSGKWLPPYCKHDCPVCYNGGVCSVQFGSCICPPGFTGDNCEDVCDTGTTGKYGPGCLLDCHCNATECQPSEGCDEGATCHTGYTGTRCLERDPNVVCPDGYYGPQCTKICHCRSSSKCDRNNGSCPNGDICEEGLAGIGCQQVLPALSDAPLMGTLANNVNIRWTSWSLDSDYGRGTVDSYQLEYWPTNDTSNLVVLNVTMGTEMNISWSQMNYNTEYSFTVKVVTEVEGVLVSGKASPLAQILSRPITATTLPPTSYEERQTTEPTTITPTTVPLTSGKERLTNGKRFKNDVPVIRVCRKGKRFSCSSNTTSESNVCKVCGKP